MNKIEIEAHLAEECGMTQAEAKRALGCVLKCISESLKSGEQVKIVDFGSFIPSTRKERQVRSPADGSLITVPETKVVKFRAGKGLKDHLNA